MNAPSQIPGQVRRIIPLLASDADGEALAACRAIKRTLSAAGLDMHALAAAIPVHGQTPKPAPGPMPSAKHRRPAPREPHEFAGYRWREAWAQHHRPRAFTPKQEAQHREQAAYCMRAGDHRLNHYEQNFIRNVLKLRGNLSYAQSSWLADIASRLDMEDRGL